MAVGAAVTVNLRDVVAGWVANPTDNRDLLLRPVSGDGTVTYSFWSSESWPPEQRPKLAVRYGGTPTPTPNFTPSPTPTQTPTPVPPNLRLHSFRRGVNGYDGNSDAHLRRYSPDTNGGG